MLTWEPRRVRFNLTRTAACGLLAFVIAIALQMVFLASFVPAVVLNGTTAGADSGWWVSLVLVILRTALLTSIAAMLGVALGNPRAQHGIRAGCGVRVDGGDRGSGPTACGQVGRSTCGARTSVRSSPGRR